MASLETIERLLEDKIKTDSAWQNKIDKHLAELNGKTTRCASALFGSGDGDIGICKELNILKSNFYKLRLYFVAIAFFLLGTGVLGGFGLAGLLGG
jgi:hypothetical protein